MPELNTPICGACNRRKVRCDHECVLAGSGQTVGQAQQAMREHLANGGRHPNWDNEKA